MWLLQYATNFELGSISPLFIHQLSRSRWRIDTEVFQTLTTDCHLKHPAVHQAQPTVFAQEGKSQKGPAASADQNAPETKPKISQSSFPATASVLTPLQSPADAATEGTTSITSAPEGADIFIDSIGHGRTPILLKLKSGKHSVQLVLSGYKDWVSDVQVEAGSIVNVTADLQK